MSPPPAAGMVSQGMSRARRTPTQLKRGLPTTIRSVSWLPSCRAAPKGQPTSPEPEAQARAGKQVGRQHQ